MELDREIECHRDGGRTRVMARDVNHRIIEDDEALPHFVRVSQNIAVVVALLRGLLGAMSPMCVGPIMRFARCSSARRHSMPRACYLGDVTSTPASARP